MSLCDKLRVAKTKEEVQMLLDKGATFTNASDRTKRKWVRIADRVKYFLS